MTLARIQSYFTNSKIAQFFVAQTTLNQILIVIGGAMAVPLILNLQIFQLFSILRDSIQGYDVNLRAFITLLTEVLLIFYSVYLFTQWSFKEEKKESIAIQDFSATPDFIAIEEYKPIVLDGKSKAETSAVHDIVSRPDIKSIIAATSDPKSFFEKLRPIDDALNQMKKEMLQEQEAVASSANDIGTGTLFDIMTKADNKKL